MEALPPDSYTMTLYKDGTLSSCVLGAHGIDSNAQGQSENTAGEVCPATLNIDPRMESSH